MARENKTRYAILGMLARQSMSGYDIKKRIEQGLVEFWNESNGQIYPIMKQLAAEGLATKIVEHHDGKPDRHVYTITDTGMEDLRSWLVKPAEPIRYRFELLLKLVFGHEAPLDESIKHIQRFREEHQSLIERYSAIERNFLDEHEGWPQLPYWLASVRCGMRVSRAFLEWCDESEAALKATNKH